MIMIKVSCLFPRLVIFVVPTRPNLRGPILLADTELGENAEERMESFSFQDSKLDIWCRRSKERRLVGYTKRRSK